MHAWVDGWMDGWMVGLMQQMDGSVQALLIHRETLGNLLFFFSLKGLLLGKALAQIFSILWPSLLGR